MKQNYMRNLLLKSIFILVTFGIVIDGIGQQASPVFRQADSLFLAGDWAAANSALTVLMKENSFDALHYNRLGFSYHNLGQYQQAEKYYRQALAMQPTGVLRQIIFGRLARVNAINNNYAEALVNLDSAIQNGYANFREMDSVKDYSGLRKEDAFKKLRERVYNQLYPCMADKKHKEFDFWIGDWDVYTTGTKTIGGHSVIQRIAGGCALLENWTSAISEGKSLNFIDPANNKWKQVWIGSYTNGQQDFVNGEFTDGAMHFNFETTDAQGHKLIGRFFFYNQGANQVRQFNETSADNGKTWNTVYDFTYIRKTQ